jgi:hypothetical protein
VIVRHLDEAGMLAMVAEEDRALAAESRDESQAGPARRP